ncbi:hypothetical protein UR08_10210 [Listeria kieliensis]|uniref:MFS transporter n=2 Tax=Listeria kieliensis TaxID=1621700 RepID=A0A3D8TRI8_9LIST|nr:hypothetical protein UR08_10210 [Listeria kieliensis]
MEPKGKFFMYAVMNATVFMPYLFFILAGNQYQGWLNGYASLIIFYVFKSTGTFLFNAFNYQAKTKSLLLVLLTMGIIGSVLASLGSFDALWIEMGAILIGISSSMALPVYITLQYHDHFYYGRKMSNRNYLRALFVIILALAIGGILARYLYPSLAFLFYAALLLITFYFVSRLPDYEVKTRSGEAFLIRPFLVFFIASFILFLFKEARTIESTDYVFWVFLAALVGILIFIGAGLYLMPRMKLKLEPWILYFSFSQGAIMSFTLLYGTFVALAEKDFNFMLFGVYMVYFLGTLFSLAVEPIVKKAWGKRPILYLYSLGIALSFVLIVIPARLSISVGIFIASLFLSMLSRHLNRSAYATATTEMQDASLLLRSRWTKLGSICGQIFLVFLLFIGSLFSALLDFKQVIAAFNGAENMSNDLFFDFAGTALVAALGILLFLFAGLRKYRGTVKK